MLLRTVDVNPHRAGVVFAQDVLHGINVVLAHVAQAATVVIPVTPEGAVYAVRMVGLELGWPEPHVVIQFCGDGRGF